MMHKRGTGYYLGGLQVQENGFYDENTAPLYSRLTKYDVTNNKWSTDAGPDTSDVGRWDGELIAIEEIGKQGIFVALGGNRAKSLRSTDKRELLDFKTVQVGVRCFEWKVVRAGNEWIRSDACA
ncbi:hypothetical protein K440DRAFT_634095 [Wilcoxina mikolae CBS 423.85]|nr:hypothetical protein K440DRAFT_634095 [Wilcoxina mikolae CBS 423.85]